MMPRKKAHSPPRQEKATPVEPVPLLPTGFCRQLRELRKRLGASPASPPRLAFEITQESPAGENLGLRVTCRDLAADPSSSFFTLIHHLGDAYLVFREIEQTLLPVPALSPSFRAWALKQYTPAEHLKGLEEARKSDGPELHDLIPDLDEDMEQHLEELAKREHRAHS